MRKLIFIALSSLLIFAFLGCATTDQNVGKRLPYNYYVVNCNSFPAQGLLKNQHIEITYQISRKEKYNYLITGIVKPVFGGDVQGTMSIKKAFISEEDFDGITIGQITGGYWY